MKHIMMTLLVILSLVACSAPPVKLIQTTTNLPAGPSAVRAAQTVTSMPTTADSAAEEAEIRALVEDFGKRLQAVPLLSSDAAQEMQKQYSGLVSPALLEMWMSDGSKAPGRMVSSPWPDRIEITALAKEDSDRYVITGFVIEVTSVEVVSGGAAARIPVRVVVQKAQGRWLIMEYAEER